jgi:hypothetical protein
MFQCPSCSYLVRAVTDRVVVPCSIILPDRSEIKLEVEYDDTVAVIKQKVEAQESIPASQQFFFFGGKPLL